MIRHVIYLAGFHPVLPFLKEVHPEQDSRSIMILAKKHRNMKQRLKTISQENDEHPLSRYAIFFGLTALKIGQLQEELEWPEEVEWIEPRGGMGMLHYQR